MEILSQIDAENMARAQRPVEDCFANTSPIRVRDRVDNNRKGYVGNWTALCPGDQASETCRSCQIRNIVRNLGIASI